MIQDDAVTQELEDIFGDRLKIDEPLARHLSMKLGGPAKWFCEVRSAEELKAGIEIVKKHENYSWFVLGDGANALANDTGFEGVVFKLGQTANAGSDKGIFKDFEVTDEDISRVDKKFDLPEPMKKQKKIAAGWIIDQLDLKGTQIGGAKISEEDGNYIINDGTATASDVVQLISIIKMKARNELGIQLQEEIKYLGF